MFETRTASQSGNKKKIRYEPIERRRKSRRDASSDRRTEPRDDGSTDRRQKHDRRK
ncbi:hypothetical protein OS175_05640 [Marinicella sp. S1101]|uniref:hypothetical protein n=1 Tax=Marinicella marina TaxID=2996016 RepID=UPI002260E87E|nr:hypothetical protein [Marinicella marina]MCX7553353.1 hypothetical protein [Marinicella marina]MDJ1139085.1 hypothetical protein [Marinicella marina]